MSRGRRRELGGVDRLPSGRWRVRIVDPGTRRRLSIGTFTTKAEAELAFARVASDQQRGAWVTPDEGRTTLAEYAPIWLDSRLTSRGEALRPRVRDLYEGYLRLHILPVLGAVPLGRLTTATVRSWHAGLLDHGPGASTVAKCYRLLRAILNTAVEDRHLVTNPCAIKGAGVEACEERTIPTVAEVYALADSVAPRYRALVLLAAFCGLRRGELFGLTRGDVDLLHRTVTVRVQRQESKRGEELTGPPKSVAGRRTVALPSELVPALEEHIARWASPKSDGLLFIGAKGAAVRPGVWQREWDRARRAIGRPNLHLHDLRHVAGTLAAATGASTKEIMRRLGHATQHAALRYQHATDERDRELAAGIDRIIQAARTNPDPPPVALRR
jgi:integrase